MAEGARLESVYTATYRGFESPLTAIFKEELVRKYGFFSHFICLCELALNATGSAKAACTAVNPALIPTSSTFFLSCLYGSELKYYTFSPLLLKQNHLNLLLPPFFILTYPQH